MTALAVTDDGIVQASTDPEKSFDETLREASDLAKEAQKVKFAVVQK